MRRANLTTMVLCTCLFTSAQNIHYPVSAPYLRSGACSKNFSTVLSATSNTASLASLQNFSIGVYGERRFMLSETSMYSAIVGLPTPSGNFAFMTNYFGYSDYNESQISLAYARKITDKVDIGAAFNYYGIRIPAYNNASAFHFQLSSIFHLTEQLHTGIHIYNPFSARIGKNPANSLASLYVAAIGYEWSKEVFTSIEIIKEQDKPAAIHTGIQYKPIAQLTGSAGYTSSLNQFYFGIGYTHRQLRLDFSASIHQYMGLSPGLLLTYLLQPKTSQ